MSRWSIAGDGIEWDVKNDKRVPHEDFTEMSGLLISFIVNYGVEADGALTLKRHLVWPTLRTIPNNTGGSFQIDLLPEELPVFEIEGARMVEKPELIRFDGVLSVRSATVHGVETRRDVFPSASARSAFERVELVNRSGKTLKLNVRNGATPKCGRGCNGVYVVECAATPCGAFELGAGESRVFGIRVSARLANEKLEPLDVDAELMRRRARVAEIAAPLELESGSKELDLLFRFSKIRAGESVFKTRGGLLHSPGGRNYYAATWCNDQIEYAGPWFAFTGDEIALEASLNAYRHYMPFMGPDFHHIPSSVVAEGFDIWEGRGDRGDAAMYAYGASRFALTTGSKAIAEELWPAIEWTLEYCRQKTTSSGVVASDTDELEGRLPAGDANLCTSALCYGGLRSAARLAASLGKESARRKYDERADALERSMETFFGRTLKGFETYRYYDGNELLRSWICIPLCMGVFKRAKGTVDAMLSPALWIGDGMLSQEGDKICWDRSALYGFRGGLMAGAMERIFPKLLDYSRSRLLGEHVPYPFEAWPEGGKRHLSAESALYCRVFTEGLFGLEPWGLSSFKVAPRIPEGVERISLKNVRAFGTRFDIVADRSSPRVERDGSTLWEAKGAGIAELEIKGGV